MKKIKINGKTIFAEYGTLLSDALIKAGINAEHPCGGMGKCKKCIVLVNGNEELSCQYRIETDISVSIPDSGEIISETGASQTGEITENVCLALDIGTTTLALALVSLNTNEIIKVITRTNPQRTFGADIMSRIDYCTKNGTEKLHTTLISEINKMIADFKLTDEVMLYVSGNTTMLHLFFGIDCSAIGVAPYTPVFLESKHESAKKLGLAGVKEVESLPSIAAFVGADLVAGLNLVEMPQKNKYNLLIDLGTNAEIVLFSEKSVLCTSAAAGPCFEGANISCGMSATNGAVYSYSDGIVKTIGNAAPKGICGTGLIDIIAGLIANKTIDKTGFMECGEFKIADGVHLSQADVRQFQLAKSAVFSAIVTLLNTEKISSDSIGNIYISGGFSAKINIANAVKTGLLPDVFFEKYIPVNNSSLLGTVKYACEKNDLSVYTKNAAYVDLSTTPDFSDLYIENMMF